ncbi:MAG: substrate-binding domain-containing protein [Planctomycetia bacterium]
MPAPLVAVVVDPSLSYDREIAKGVAQYAREVGDWRLYVEEEQDRRLPDFDAWPGQGIIASFDTDRVARRVTAAGLPVVAVGGGGGAFDAASGIPYVDTDNERIAVLAAEHLLERAIPHFGFYGLAPSPVAVWSDARFEAFARRLRAADKPVQTLIPRHDSIRWSLLQDELKTWLAALPKPAGIMACDDVRARHVLEACRSLGLRVPHDVAVIGVDDDEFVCELSDPPLSSVAQAARHVGYEAAFLLDRLMRPTNFATDKKTAGPVPPRTVVPPVGVVARRSTDTLAVADPVIAAAIRTIRERAVMGLEIGELVAASKLSRWQLEDRFRRVVGRSIHEDMLHVRLNEARRLITTTDLPLKQIAPRAGFRSVAYMTTLFRSHFNVTPAALRTSARGRGEQAGHR